MQRSALLFLLLFPLFSWAQVTDHEGNTYKTVKIGNQTWMAENLSIRTFKNGEDIYVCDEEDDWWVSGEDGLAAMAEYELETENGLVPLRYYNYYVLTDPRGIVPEGWRIPTNEDWNILAQNLGGSQAATAKLKSAAGWYSDEENGTNESGFEALPVGMLDDAGELQNWKEGAFFWSIDPSEEFIAIIRNLMDNRFSFEKAESFNSNGLSIRLIKN